MCERNLRAGRNRHLRCMEATHRSVRYVLFNFKSGCEIGQTAAHQCRYTLRHDCRRSIALMKAIAVIPARLASTRLPRKMLREIAGKPLIGVVYEAVRSSPLAGGRIDRHRFRRNHERLPRTWLERADDFCRLIAAAPSGCMKFRTARQRTFTSTCRAMNRWSGPNISRRCCRSWKIRRRRSAR